MRLSYRVGTAMALALCFAAVAGAQMGGGPPGGGQRGGGMMMSPSLHGVWNPVVGAGAAYSIQHADGTTSEMEIAIVGKESVNGKDGYWMEISIPRGDAQMVLKSLLVLDGANTTTVRMIMQPPGHDPMEMPSEMMQRRGPQPADVRSDSEDVGSESVTTPAGTFKTEHFRRKDGTGDVWVAKEVPPWGLIKTTSKDTSLTLVRVITDAKDKITGTPKPFNPMEMQQRRPPN